LKLYCQKPGCIEPHISSIFFLAYSELSCQVLNYTMAVAARADLIVSGNRQHLLPLGSHQGIDIVEAAEAVMGA